MKHFNKNQKHQKSLLANAFLADPMPMAQVRTLLSYVEMSDGPGRSGDVMGLAKAEPSHSKSVSRKVCIRHVQCI